MTGRGMPPGHPARAAVPDAAAPGTISQALQVTGPLPGAAPGEEALRVPRLAAALTGIALTGPVQTMGRTIAAATPAATTLRRTCGSR